MSKINNVLNYFQWSVLPLDDNFSEDDICYEVHVYTGFHSKSGTDSNVFLVVAGTECDSGIRRLTTVGRKVC